MRSGLWANEQTVIVVNDMPTCITIRDGMVHSTGAYLPNECPLHAKKATGYYSISFKCH